MDTQNTAINAIGYFLLSRLSKVRGYVGAMFVTDHEGVPLEFKCTEAIKPTLIQQSLYGETLERHVAVKLCAVPLLKAINRKPEIVFVNEPSFLTIREHIDIPTLLIERSDKVSDDTQDSNVLKPHSHHEHDINFNEFIRQSCHFDLLEPFDRIKHAVALLGEKDERYR